MGARIMAKIKANEKKMNSNSQIWTSGPRLDFNRYIAVSGSRASSLVLWAVGDRDPGMLRC
jgi:hypothetical protein